MISRYHLSAVFKIIVLITIANTLTPGAEGKNILFVFGGGTYSLEINISPLVKSLADNGHNITFLSSYLKKPFSHPYVEIIAPPALVSRMANNLGEEKLSLRLKHGEKKPFNALPEWAVGNCEIILDSPDDPFLNSLFYTNRTYDLVIIDAVVNDCGFIISHYFKAKTIIFEPSPVFPWQYDIFGLPLEESWIPVMSSIFDFPMTFANRLENYFESLLWTYRRHSYLYPKLENIMRKFMKTENVPSYIDLQRNTSLVLINGHPSTDFPRSVPPLFVNIGGMQCWDDELQIPTEIKAYIEGSEKGVVLIVFGSSVNLAEMPRHIITAFFQAIEKHNDYRFIWKWTGERPRNSPKNLKMVPWIPQKEVLGHPKVKLLVTHCGLNSIMEATFHGVPLVGIPLFGDQDYNAYRIQAEELGVRLEVRELTAEVIWEAISTVLNQQSYKENMKKMSIAFRDRPENPVKTAVYWVEYVLRTDDTSFLKPKNLHQNPFVRRSLDIIAFLVFTVLLSVLLTFFIFGFARRFITKQSKNILFIAKKEN